MSPTEHTAMKPSAATGFFALLGPLLHIQGATTSKITKGTSASFLICPKNNF
jgi:hypothetical protein